MAKGSEKRFAPTRRTGLGATVVVAVRRRMTRPKVAVAARATQRGAMGAIEEAHR